MNMFFRRKSWLRKEFNDQLISQMEQLKTSWNNQKALLNKSFDPSEDIICQTKIAEAKYFFLFKEAKHRNIKIDR
jgi:hypothetical protein